MPPSAASDLFDEVIDAPDLNDRETSLRAAKSLDGILLDINPSVLGAAPGLPLGAGQEPPSRRFAARLDAEAARVAQELARLLAEGAPQPPTPRPDPETPFLAGRLPAIAHAIAQPRHFVAPAHAAHSSARPASSLEHMEPQPPLDEHEHGPLARPPQRGHDDTVGDAPRPELDFELDSLYEEGELGGWAPPGPDGHLPVDEAAAPGTARVLERPALELYLATLLAASTDSVAQLLAPVAERPLPMGVAGVHLAGMARDTAVCVVVQPADATHDLLLQLGLSEEEGSAQGLVGRAAAPRHRLGSVLMLDEHMAPLLPALEHMVRRPPHAADVFLLVLGLGAPTRPRGPRRVLQSETYAVVYGEPGAHGDDGSVLAAPAPELGAFPDSPQTPAPRLTFAESAKREFRRAEVLTPGEAADARVAREHDQPEAPVVVAKDRTEAVLFPLHAAHTSIALRGLAPGQAWTSGPGPFCAPASIIYALGLVAQGLPPLTPLHVRLTRASAAGIASALEALNLAHLHADSIESLPPMRGVELVVHWPELELASDAALAPEAMERQVGRRVLSLLDTLATHPKRAGLVEQVGLTLLDLAPGHSLPGPNAKQTQERVWRAWRGRSDTFDLVPFVAPFGPAGVVRLGMLAVARGGHLATRLAALWAQAPTHPAGHLLLRDAEARRTGLALDIQALAAAGLGALERATRFNVALAVALAAAPDGASPSPWTVLPRLGPDPSPSPGPLLDRPVVLGMLVSVDMAMVLEGLARFCPPDPAVAACWKAHGVRRMPAGTIDVAALRTLSAAYAHHQRSSSTRLIDFCQYAGLYLPSGPTAAAPRVARAALL